MWLRVLLMLLCALPFGSRAEPAIGIVTIVEGEIFATRESTRFALAEGVRVMADDIVETAPQAKLARIEFGDGLILDIGPNTRVLMTPRFPGERGGKRAAKLYVLQGWAKITVPKALAGASFASESFDLTGIARDVVLNVEPSASAVFAESGELTLIERSKGKAGTSVKLKSGEFLTRAGEAKSVLTQRPAADFIARVPRAFLDTLPTRAALFATREVPPKRLAPITYADVQAWVDAEAGLRPLFVTRWKALAQAPDFRRGLVAGLRAHPEWDRTLFPEKYLPKPAASSASAGSPSYR
ncbi:MAG: hypothetical protein Q8R33_14180 [Burkholderiales bacterium]|nr:hypothetical protein [Burkholderiales bacterium]